MPRKVTPKPKPLERHTFYDGIIPVEVEVWDNKADVGTRGSWNKRKASSALDLLMEIFIDKIYLTNPTPQQITRIKLTRMSIKGPTQALALEIAPILKTRKLYLELRARWSIAKDLKIHLRAIENALKK